MGIHTAAVDVPVEGDDIKKVPGWILWACISHGATADNVRSLRGAEGTRPPDYGFITLGAGIS